MKMKLNYGINKKVSYNNHIYLDDKIEVDYIEDKQEMHKKIKEAICDKHPGWNLTGYCILEVS